MSQAKAKSGTKRTKAKASPGLILRSQRIYVQRNGETVKVERHPKSTRFPFRNVANHEETWTLEGKWRSDGISSDYDLVALATNKTSPSSKPRSELKLEVGKFYRTARGNKVFCAVELAGQEFAILYDFVEEEGKFNYVERYCSNGEVVLSGDRDDNIIAEWIDPPKTKKILVYPALVSVSARGLRHLSGARVVVTRTYYDNEADAKAAVGTDFIRLLTEKPIEIEVPV